MASCEYFHNNQKIATGIPELKNFLFAGGLEQLLPEMEGVPKLVSTDNNDIRYSLRQDADIEIPVETAVQKTQRLFQNGLNRIKIIQDTILANGGVIDDSSDVYKATEEHPNKAGASILNFKNAVVKPLEKRIAALRDKDGKQGLQKDVALLIYAKHAEEANAHVSAINPKYKGDAGSGMTNAEAEEEILRLQEKYGDNFSTLERLADDFQAITKTSLELLHDSGAISTDRYEAYKNSYDYYAPLKGFEEVDQDGNITQLGTGRGMSSSQFAKRRLGRSSRAGQILENIIRDHERAIVLSNKAANVHTALLKLLADNPAMVGDGKLFEIDNKPTQLGLVKKTKFVVTYHGSKIGEFDTIKDARQFVQDSLDDSNVAAKRVKKNFKIENETIEQVGQVPKPFNPEEEIKVFQNGKELRIKPSDALFIRAFNDLSNENLTGVYKLASDINRWLRAAWTQKNPAFPLINIVRDVQQAAAVLTGEKGFAFALKTLSKEATSWKEVFDYARNGVLSPDMKRLLDAGGSIGTAYISNLESISDSMHNELARAGAESIFDLIRQKEYRQAASDAWFRTWNNWLFDFIEQFNSAFENSTRLATFKQATESGINDREAARMARDVTVNFSRHGELGKKIGSLYLFYNANVQGSQNLWRSLTESEHKQQVWAMAGTLMSLGFMAALIGGDDGDDDLIPDYEKERNLIIPLGDGNRANIPLPYGWSVFSDIGRAFAQLANGGDSEKISRKLASAFMGNFSPVGNPIPGAEFDQKNALVTLTPTALKPMTMSAVNRNAFGSALMPEKAWQPNQPDSEKLFRTTRGTVYESLSNFLNSATGGDYANEGWISISPESFKNTLNFLVGGAGRFLADIAAVAATPFSTSELHPRNIPVFKSFAKAESIDDYRRRFYEQAAQVEAIKERFNVYRHEQDKESMTELKADNSKELRLAKLVKTTKERIKALREKEDSARLSGDWETVRAIEEREKALMKRFNLRFVA